MSRLSPLCGQGVIGVRMPGSIRRVMVPLAGKDTGWGVLAVVQSLSCVWPPVTYECSTPSFTVSWLLSFIPLSQWCHPTISSSAVLFSFCLQSFPSPGSFPMSWFFPSGGQTIGALASASALPMNIQDWFPLGLTGLISLQSKGLSGVFSSATIWRHQFFGTQPSLWSNSHIHTWLLEKP